MSKKKDLNYKKMTQEEALHALRSKKSEPGSMESFLYFLTSDSPPEFKDHIEGQAADLMTACHNMFRALASADKDPDLRAMMIRKLKTMQADIQDKNIQDDEQED